MMNNFDDLQKVGKDNMDVAMKSFGAFSKGMQSIAVEVADYQKKSFEDGTAAVEKVLASKSLDKALEAQADFFRNAYEGYVGQVTKVGELYMDAAREAYKPFENVVAKTTK